MVNASVSDDTPTDSSFEAMPNVTRKWELFPGNNKFCCDGRIMTAPNTGVFYLTTTLIVGTSILFFTFDCPFLAARITPAIPVVGGLMFIFVISTFLRTSFSDPGVIPRATPDEAAYIEKQIVPNNANSPTYRPPPRTKEIQVRGHLVKLKYCSTCKIFRPPRASHCSLCDNCVERFDHHCPWVGNCVGKRNYRHFYMFIVSLSFLCVFIFACAVTHIILLTREDRQFIDAVKDSPASVISGLICFLSVWTILGLSGFHTYLTASNQTTNEDIKGVFTRRRGTDGFNPYSESNVCSNCLFVLCAPVTPSLIDRRGIVTPEYAAEREAEKLREQEVAAANNKTYGSVINMQPTSVPNGVPVPQEAPSQTQYPQLNQQEHPPMMEQAKYPHFQMSHQRLIQQQQHLHQLQQLQMQQERAQPPPNNATTPGSGKSVPVHPSPAHPTMNGVYVGTEAGNYPYGHVVGPYNYASLPSRRHHYRGAVDYRIRQFSPYRDTVAVQNCWDDVYSSRMSGGEGFTCTVDVASTSMGGGSVGFHRNYAVGPRTGMGCSVIGAASGFVVPVYGQPVNHMSHGYGQPAGSAGGLMGFEEVLQQCAPYSEAYVNFGRTGKSGLQMAYKVTSASNSDDDCGLEMRILEQPASSEIHICEKDRQPDTRVPSALDDLDLDMDVPVIGTPSRGLYSQGDVGIPLSASRLRLLQDTTMIESALDLDSLEDSSVGGGSTAGLLKLNRP